MVLDSKGMSKLRSVVPCAQVILALALAGCDSTTSFSASKSWEQPVFLPEQGDSGDLQILNSQYVDVAWRMPKSGEPCHYFATVTTPASTVPVLFQTGFLYLTDARSPDTQPYPFSLVTAYTANDFRTLDAGLQFGGLGANRSFQVPSVSGRPQGGFTNSIEDTHIANASFLRLFGAPSIESPVLHFVVFSDGVPGTYSVRVRWDHCAASWKSGAFEGSLEKSAVNFSGGTSVLVTAPWYADGSKLDVHLPALRGIRVLFYSLPSTTAPSMGTATIQSPGGAPREVEGFALELSAQVSEWTVTLHNVVSEVALDTPVVFAVEFAPATAF